MLQIADMWNRYQGTNILENFCFLDMFFVIGTIISTFSQKKNLVYYIAVFHLFLH